MMNLNFSKKVYIILISIALVSFMVWYFPGLKSSGNSKGQANTIPISIGHISIRAYLATTTDDQERGLGGRESISSDESMLFVFDTPDIYSFWMKDMKFPIDIFWVDEFKHIIFIKEDALPSSFPENFAPQSPAKYVLETQSGFAKKNDVKIGDSVLF